MKHTNYPTKDYPQELDVTFAPPVGYLFVLQPVDLYCKKWISLWADKEYIPLQISTNPMRQMLWLSQTSLVLGLSSSFVLLFWERRV